MPWQALNNVDSWVFVALDRGLVAAVEGGLRSVELDHALFGVGTSP